MTDEAYSFDATQVPDGGYQHQSRRLRCAFAHSSGSPDRRKNQRPLSSIDTTPPEITNFKATGQPAVCEQNRCRKPFLITFDAVDAVSPIAHAGYSLDAGPWQHVDPVGMLSDSKSEHYEFHISADVQDGKIGEHLITVRAYDRYDNEA